MKKTILFSLLFLTLTAFSLPSEGTGTPHINVIIIDGVINPVTAEFITKSIEKTEQEGKECLIIELDTPGGLVESTRTIVKKMMAADIPVVVFVSPSGARAASAGTFITLASHVAVMAPGTNIGAAHPVTIQGGEDKESSMFKKIENDLAAYIIGIANKTGRNAEWAEKAVRESVSITAETALKENIIDLVCKDTDELLEKIHERKVLIGEGEKVLNTKGAQLTYLEMSFSQQFFNVITDPNIAYLLMMLGMAGLFFELKSPGLIFPGVVGVISLILAFYGMQTLPINYAGLFLIIFGIFLFILELYVPSFGLLTTGGIVSLVLGSMMLIDTPYPFLKISLNIIIPVSLSIAALFFFIAGAVVRAHVSKVSTGKEGLIGIQGLAETDIMEKGTIYVRGELWSAVSTEEIKANDDIEVVGIKGLTLEVKKINK